MFDREVAIYKRLQEQGINVSFVTYGGAREMRYADRIPGISILFNRWGLPRHWYERLLPYLHLRHMWRADVYKTNQIRGADMALRVKQLFHNKPVIVRCGWLPSQFASWLHGDDSEALLNARGQEEQVFVDANLVVVTAEHIKQYIADQYELENSKVEVIPNYVLTDLFKPNPEITPKPGQLCFVGRLEAQKNLFDLLEAISGLDVELEIIGDGSQREALESKVRDLGINVRFLGNLPHTELPEHFNAAHIFILPSLYEGNPKTLLEAMACGLPVIGTDVQGIREILQHRETGFLCGTSPQELRRAIVEVMSNPSLQERMRQKARKYVVENFSLERVLEMELALLRKIKTLRNA